MNYIKPFILVLIIYIGSMLSMAQGQVTNISAWEKEKKEIILITQDNKYGILDYDQKIVLNPIYDEIIPYQKYNLYITKKGKQFGYAIKQWEHEGLVKEDTWIVSNEIYDSLFFSVEMKTLVYLKNSKYGFFDLDFYQTNHRVYEYSISSIKTTENYYDSVYYVNKDLLTFRQNNLYGIRNKYGHMIYPQFDTPPKTPYWANGNTTITIQHQNKYGLLSYFFKSQKAILPYDEEPLQFKGNYYFVKEDDAWGVVYASYNSKEEGTNIFEIIPSEYKELTQLKADIRHIIPIDYNPLDKNNTVNDGFSGGVFTSTIGKPLSIREYFYHPSYRNKKTYFTLRPTWNGRVVTQDSSYEYLFNEISHLGIYALLKTKRVNSEWGELIRNYFIRDAAGGTSYIKGPTEPYEKSKLKAVITYDRDYDTLVQLHAFEEESDSITYDILYSSGTGIYYGGHESGFQWVLKSTLIKKNKYKHEFFDYYGTLIYTVISKHPINTWRSVGYPNYEFSYYNTRVCRYNGKKEKFRKR